MPPFDPALLARLTRRYAPVGKPVQAPKKPRRKLIPYPKNPLAPWGNPLINQEAGRRVDALLGPEMAASKRRTTQDIQTLQAVAQAAAAVLQGEAPRTQQGYADAAAELAGIGTGYVGGLRETAAADAAREADFAARAGQSAPAAAPDPTNAIYHGGVGIPGSSLVSQGASARALAEAQPGLAERRSVEDIHQRVQQGEQELLDLAQKRPELRQQVMDELYKRELEKMDARLKQQAQDLYASQFGETVRHHVAGEKEAAQRNKLSAQRNRIAARRARLAEKNYNLAVKKHQDAMAQAAREGRQPDAALSGKYGHIVDQNGDPILDKHGNQIPVATSRSKGGGKNGGLTPSQQRSNTRMAGKAAENMFNDSQPGPPDSYGDPTPAKHKWTFAAAQNYLMQTYGITRAKARQLLIAAGFKPKGRDMRR